ncbi:gp39 [Streptococcus pneumoniae]|nr:gp39 [Streptococcus pneumoniae]
MKMSEFKTIETQEELDNIVKERIRREREKIQ